MNQNPALRFTQRLDSYARAFARLDELVCLLTSASPGSIFSIEETGINSEIAREALIKRFEFTQELSWNLLKDYLCYQGETEISGSRDSYRKGLRAGLIESGIWMDMIADRDLSAHDYNDNKAWAICQRIISVYHPLMRKLLDDMRKRESWMREEETS